MEMSTKNGSKINSGLQKLNQCMAYFSACRIIVSSEVLASNLLGLLLILGVEITTELSNVSIPTCVAVLKLRQSAHPAVVFISNKKPLYS